MSWTSAVANRGISSEDPIDIESLVAPAETDEGPTPSKPQPSKRPPSKSIGLVARVKKTTSRAVEFARDKERQYSAIQARRRWQSECDTKRALLNRLRYEGSNNVPFVLQPDERAFFTPSDVGLVEARRGPSHYAGSSAGASKDVGLLGRRSVSVGKSQGEVTQGAEAPTQIDRGTAAVTNRRVVFQGSLHTRDWPFSSLLALSPLAGTNTFLIGVSDRDTTSGLALGPMYQDFKNWLDVAMCNFRGDIEADRSRVQAELAELEAHPPELTE